MTHCHTILEKLRNKGYRITPQRELIIQAVAHSSQHITAEEAPSGWLGALTFGSLCWPQVHAIIGSSGSRGEVAAED